MKSCLFRVKTAHHRSSPRRHSFCYDFYTFCIDLSELELLSKKSKLFRFNSRHLFSFWEKDHLTMGRESLFENVKEFLKQSGFFGDVQRIVLVTNLRVLGYVFNPVSFYFCYDKNDQLLCSVPEVGNTFGEVKPYFGKVNPNGKSTLQDPDVRILATKNFYVSPFVTLDSQFEFLLNAPGDTLRIAVNSYENQRIILKTTLVGKKIPWNDRNLLKLFFRFPIVTVQIITAIHWQAFLLWIKKIPFLRKKDFMEKQTGVPLGEISQPYLEP